MLALVAPGPVLTKQMPGPRSACHAPLPCARAALLPADDEADRVARLIEGFDGGEEAFPGTQ